MKKGTVKRKEPESREILPGYEAYPSSEDIYRNEKEEQDIDPEDISEQKSSLHERKQTEKRSPDRMDQRAIWIFLVQNWIMTWKTLGVRMKKTTITV